MSSSLQPPRSLRGRRARRIYRELAQELSSRLIQVHAGTGALLAAYANAIAEIEADPSGATASDLKELKGLGRALGLTR